MITTKSPRAHRVEETLHDPARLTVPGDDNTPNGGRYADTFGNDFRTSAELPWGPRYEQQVLTLMSSARVSEDGTRCVPVGETLGVFIQTTGSDGTFEEAVAGTPQDSPVHPTYFDLVVDDGRQRGSRSAIEINRRLDEIKARYIDAVWAKTTDAAERESLFVQAVKNNAAAPAYLTEPFLRELLRDSPHAQSPSRFFDDDGDVLPIRFRVEVRGEDVDLRDPRVLTRNIARKESSIPSTRAVLAKQFAKILGAIGIDGKPAYTAYTLAQEIGWSTDTVNNVLHYAEIAPAIRSEVDAGRVALKLCVTGRDCVCYGFSQAETRADGTLRTAPVRKLLSEPVQLAIWADLLRAMSIEADSEAGIPDNESTRRLLRGIKARLLAGTEFASPEDAAVMAKAARNATADGTFPTVTGDSDKDRNRGPNSGGSGGSGDSDRDLVDDMEDEADRRGLGTSDTHTSRAPAVDRHPGTAPAKLDLRAALAERAKKLSFDPAAVSVPSSAPRRERQIAVATAIAVAAFVSGDDAALRAFPDVAEALGLTIETPKPVATAKKQRPRAAKPQPGDIVLAAVDKWEASGDGVEEARAVAKHLNESAVEIFGEDVEGETIMTASNLLRRAVEAWEGDDVDGVAPQRLQDDFAGHIRDYCLEQMVGGEEAAK